MCLNQIKAASLLATFALYGCASRGVPVEIPDFPKPENASANTTAYMPDNTLRLCAGIRVSNAPASASGRIRHYSPYVVISGVTLLAAPARGACLSSGFGPRGRKGKIHKGIDLQLRTPGMIHAAGNGIILEQRYHRDFGNMLLIDHGRNVFTRYAHLAKFDNGLTAGRTVNTGTPLGIMGNTGATSAVHLHYEILTGNYNTAKRSFGLRAHNPFNATQWR